jgi:hypothetical protein
MKIKVSEAKDQVLDYLVAKCKELLKDQGGNLELFDTELKAHPSSLGTVFTPSTDWVQGGPIIELEGISIVQQGDAADWVASVYNHNQDDWHLHTAGPTPLIAACRCYVASKLGDDFEVPEELLK